MYLLVDGGTDPAWNLAAEEYLLSRRSEPFFRLWRNADSVIIGRHQNAWAEIDLDFVQRNHIPVVRRMTGGGAVFHDLGNVNYSFFDLKGRRFTDVILAALQALGIEGQASGRNDLILADGRKFSGTAVCKRGNRLLEHGTLLFSSQMSDVANALKVDPSKFDDKAVKSVRSRVTNISEHLPEPMTVLQFRDYLMDFIMKQNQMTELQNLTDEEEAIVGKLVTEKYQTWEWNYGKSPEYSMNKKVRTKGGSVQVIADIREGHIRDLQFFGDFFGEKDPQELADQLIGIRLDRQFVSEALTNININDYFHNVTHDDIINLLC
jgi:lipoate-protein ligase A